MNLPIGRLALQRTDTRVKLSEPRCLMLGIAFNLGTGSQSPTCPEFISAGNLVTAFPDWNASVPSGYTQEQFNLAQLSYYSSVNTACQCRDAGIAFAACAW